MSCHATGRKTGWGLLLGVAAAAAVVAIVSASEPPPSVGGFWPTAASALAVSLVVLFAFLSGGAAHRRLSEAMHEDWGAMRAVLSAIPDGLLVVRDGRICSVNRRFCEMLGYDREELLGVSMPFPFWPPEHRHELDAWHSALQQQAHAAGELTLVRLDGERVHVAVAGRRVDTDTDAPRYIVTVRDLSSSRRRELRLAELSCRDPHTGLPDHMELESLLGRAVRHAIAHEEHLSLVFAEVSVGGSASPGVFGRPEAIVAIARLQELIRADDVLARTGDAELAWVLPETDAHGAVGAIARARMALSSVPGVALTVGICDLATAGDAIALCAFADRALVEARDQGVGGTAQYVTVATA
jgi:PAS domain S-box-containing protein